MNTQSQIWRDPPEGCLWPWDPPVGCLAGAEPNGPVVVIIPTLGMSLSHGNPLRRPIPHGEYVSRWPSPECRLVGSDPHKHVRMSTMASSQTIRRKYQVLMSNNMECVKYLNGLSLCHHVSNMEYSRYVVAYQYVSMLQFHSLLVSSAPLWHSCSLWQNMATMFQSTYSKS